MATAKKKKRRVRKPVDYSARFSRILTENGIGGWEREFKFAPDRRFRSDFAWPEERILLEIEGGVFVRGRHVRPAGYERDCLKYSLAASLGYLVLRFTPNHIESGEAIEILLETLKRVA
jgi:very-short-patch-repair endonuclease